MNCECLLMFIFGVGVGGIACWWMVTGACERTIAALQKEVSGLQDTAKQTKDAQDHKFKNGFAFAKQEGFNEGYEAGFTNCKAEIERHIDSMSHIPF